MQLFILRLWFDGGPINQLHPLHRLPLLGDFQGLSKMHKQRGAVAVHAQDVFLHSVQNLERGVVFVRDAEPRVFLGHYPDTGDGMAAIFEGYFQCARIKGQ